MKLLTVSLFSGVLTRVNNRLCETAHSLSALAVLLLATVLVPVGWGGDFIWIEGEAATAQTVTRHPWWYDKVKTAELSGGDYISNWGAKPGEVTYAFDAPAEKTYTFWIRANPTGTKLSYQLDGAEWKPIDMAANQQGIINLAQDEKNDLRYMAWANVGAVTLSKGAHSIKFKMDSANNNHGMLDCFVFTASPFNPDGATKPGEKSTAMRDETGKWAFIPERDEFSADSKLDLRSLNEKVAGESGYVTRSKDGNDFLLGNGQPARFWAINSAAVLDNPSLDMARHARFLAKRGINMIRVHGNITPVGTNLLEINREELEKLWKTVAAMKKEGVYVTYSPYWAGTSRVKPAMGVLDSSGGGNAGALFFDKKLQAAYCSWIKQVLTEKNPHTGIPLSQDPALAIFQIQNEDSLLFFSSQSIKGEAKKELRRQYFAFLVKKYGSYEKALANWENSGVPGGQDAPDDITNKEAGLSIIWELTQRRGGPGPQKRCSDQMEFFTKLMYDFNKMVANVVHNEIKSKVLINAGNWRTADNVTMLDAERYSYQPTEIMGVNRYYCGAHTGPRAGYSFLKGDQFTDECVLLNPRALPLTLKQVDGYPIIIPESSWVPPLGYQSEGPFMVATYQSLSGVDVYYWFAEGDEGWHAPRPEYDWKWTCATPMLMGQWPAAALIYRMGYVKQAAPVVFEQRSLTDLWERRMPIIAEDAGYDPNRDKDNLSKESNVKNGINPLAYLVGPVVTKYGGDPAQSKVIDFAPYINPASKTVKSVTGELNLDYGKGICTLNTPKAQGVTGFLNTVDAFKLGDVEIKSGNPYATVLVVSMDNKALKTSARILVQVGTIARPTGWKTKPVKVEKADGEEIVSCGKSPWQVVNGDVTLTIANPALKSAKVLDVNGMVVKEATLEAVPGGKRLQFPADALYVILQ